MSIYHIQVVEEAGSASMAPRQTVYGSNTHGTEVKEGTELPCLHPPVKVTSLPFSIQMRSGSILVGCKKSPVSWMKRGVANVSKPKFSYGHCSLLTF